MENDSAEQEVDPAASELTSEIVKCGEEAQVQASAQLRAHRGQMFNDPACSDVAFLCNDGKRVLASRILLADKSALLKGMFMSGMAESRLSEISLPEISSPVLLSVFEFLYKGTLSKHHPQSWRMACELIDASRFFLEPNLEKITRKVMHKITSGVEQDLPKVASLLTEAVQFKSLCDEMDVNLMQLVTILSSNWSDSVFVRSLSEEAFHYLLEKSKGSSVDDVKLTFTEYLRFRQVIRCCIAKSDEEQPVEELLNFMVPDEYQALSLINPGIPRKVRSLPKHASISSDSSPLHGDEKIRNLAIKLSSNIDCRKIHPVLLATVVEPLNIISAAEIQDSFRFHALRRKVIFKRPVCGWHHGESYNTLKQGSVIKKNCWGIGLAVSKAAISRSCGIYQWRFTVQEYPDTFCEFGFIYYGNGMRMGKPKLQNTRLCAHQHARSLIFFRLSDDEFQKITVKVNWQGAAGHRGWKSVLRVHTFKGLSALFTFNASEHTCSLSFGGKNVGVVWNNLPAAVCNPAVSLGNSSKGRVRMELVSGFGML